jgi:hypothetical protein
MSDWKVVRCDDCKKEWGEDDYIPLEETIELNRRLDPGSIVPAGECPDCGALVYLISRGALPRQGTKVFDTKCYGIRVEVQMPRRVGKLTSDLHDETNASACKELEAAINALEAIILAHACAGIDICSEDYIEGIETAVDKICNRYGE